MSGNMSNPFSTQAASYHSQFPSSPIPTLDRLDEGYSEETRSLIGSDGVLTPDSQLEAMGEQGLDDPLTTLPDWIMALSEQDRSDLAHTILRTLRTSSIAAIVERLNPLLHLDPVLRLPSEMIYEVFSYLKPRDLLKASVASRSWRKSTLDSHLWKQLYGFEGWDVDQQAIAKFEKANSKPDASAERQMRIRRAETDAGYPAIKKRMPESGLFARRQSPNHSVNMNTDTTSNGEHQTWRVQHDTVEADEFSSTRLHQVSTASREGDRMHGVDYCGTPERTNDEILQPSTSQMAIPGQHSQGSLPMDAGDVSFSYSPGDRASVTHAPQPLPVNLPAPELLASPQSPGISKINWQFLYKQRKRLEDNWNAGRYKNFQLPHPEHLYEAHQECVYTIQYSDKYLVSGSRDRTVRIWNLETKRLVRKPLVGHKMSVLCLQFDERPEHDIIISGSSDTDVIIWRFSTGEMIKKIEQAHGDPVLNLRFDERFLVTCSKDKTIKVWNRKEMLPGDKDLPAPNSRSTVKLPAHIVAMNSHASLVAENKPAGKQTPLPPYHLLMKLEGHQAAVNAIQLYKDQVVSASGDRNVKLWNIHTGDCEMTLPGHMKGIACVQFDGRRIVSGSSDNTVRIYDRATGAEVACLRGHSDLVRTVQAGFGDLPGTDADLKAEARAIDKEFFNARRSGLHPLSMERSNHQQRNSEPREPRDITAYGAHLPPGGGGSRWGRIVSGSYDQTVIIWKKNSDGRWVINQKLRQEEAVRSAGGPFAPNSAAAIVRAVLAHGSTPAPVQQNASAPGPALTPAPPTPAPNANPTVSQPITAVPGSTSAQQHPTMALINNTSTTGQQSQAAGLPQVQQATQGMHQATQGTQQMLANTNTPGGQPQSGPSNPNHSAQAQTTVTQASSQAPPPQINAGGHPQGNIGGHGHGHGHGHGPAPGSAAAVAAAQANSRVFKLQFDSRRIICCSQDPRIVGWDFANGDEDIIEASKFFTGP